MLVKCGMAVGSKLPVHCLCVLFCSRALPGGFDQRMSIVGYHRPRSQTTTLLSQDATTGSMFLSIIGRQVSKLFCMRRVASRLPAGKAGMTLDSAFNIVRFMLAPWGLDIHLVTPHSDFNLMKFMMAPWGSGNHVVTPDSAFSLLNFMMAPWGSDKHVATPDCHGRVSVFHPGEKAGLEVALHADKTIHIAKECTEHRPSNTLSMFVSLVQSSF